MKNYYTIGAVALGLAFPVMGLVLSSAFLAYVSIKAIEKNKQRFSELNKNIQRTIQWVSKIETLLQQTLEYFLNPYLGSNYSLIKEFIKTKCHKLATGINKHLCHLYAKYVYGIDSEVVKSQYEYAKYEWEACLIVACGILLTSLMISIPLLSPFC